MENPYESPTSPARLAPQEEAPREEEKTPLTVPPHYAQFALRILGIYFFVWAVLTIVQRIAATLADLRHAGLLVDSFSQQGIALLFAGESVADLLQLAVGLYFCLGGRWVIEAIFTNANRTST